MFEMLDQEGDSSSSEDEATQTAKTAFLSSRLQRFNTSKNTFSTSIISSKNVSLSIKIIIPIIIILNIFVYLASNLSYGATVEFSFRLIGVKFGEYDLFNFSLINTVKDMYNGKVYFLGTLVLLWSGVWPYLKLVLLMIAWFIPTKTMSKTARGRMLFVMDALGKWCMLDTFLLVMMSCAFHFDLVIIHPAIFALNVTVLSKFGLYSFVFGCILSLILSHALLAYHRNATILPRKINLNEFLPLNHDDDINALRENLLTNEHNYSEIDLNLLISQRSPNYQEEVQSLNRRFCCRCPEGSWFDIGSLRPNKTADKRLSLLRFLFLNNLKFKKQSWRNRLKIGAVHLLIGLSLVFTCITLIGGSFMNSFAFTYTGVAGDFISLVDPSLLRTKYSLISIAETLIKNLKPKPFEPAKEPEYQLDSALEFANFFSPSEFLPSVNENIVKELLSLTNYTELRHISSGEIVGGYIIQAVYLIFAFITPLCLTIFLFALWFMPMSLRNQKIVFYVIEIISAWSAVDVFIVCIIGANLEIGQFAYFLLLPECKVIEDVIKGVDINFNQKCFSIDTEYLDGFYVLIVAAIALTALSEFIQKIAEEAINTRESLALIEIAKIEELANG